MRVAYWGPSGSTSRGAPRLLGTASSLFLRVVMRAAIYSLLSLGLALCYSARLFKHCLNEY